MSLSCQIFIDKCEIMALTNAEHQARFKERHQGDEKGLKHKLCPVANDRHVQSLTVAFLITL